MDIFKEYDDVFRDIVYCYLEDKNINTITSDEVAIIANRLITKNEPMWEYIKECVGYEVNRIRDLRKKNKKEEDR